MKRRQPNPDPRLAAIGDRLARDLVAGLEAEGLPLAPEVYRAAEPHLAMAFARLIDARAKAVSERRRAEQETWARAAGLLSRAAVQEQLGLIDGEVATAEQLGLLRDVPLPSCLADQGAAAGRHRYYHPVELTPEQRAQIARETLLTRVQAAAYLRMPAARFDQLRIACGLEHAAKQVGYSGWPTYLYRLADLRHLACVACPDTGNEKDMAQ